MWAYPVTLSTIVLLAVALDRPMRVLATSGALAVIYFGVVALPLDADVPARSTALVNALAFPGFAMVAFFVSSFVRKLADAADSARKRVAELEQDRSRAVVHDLLAYLRLDRFAEADERTRTLMIAQAQAKHDQMRSYVNGASDTRDIEKRMAAVLRLHPGLPINQIVKVEPGFEVPEETLGQLVRALDTALSNVEQHAPGASVMVIVQSDVNDLSVTVSDDGPGFDQASSPPGFGIREILGRQLEEVGGKGEVRSRRDSGTQVRIMVPGGRQG